MLCPLNPFIIFIFLVYIVNEIDGEAFLELSEDDIKEIIKPLGVVKKVSRILKTVLEEPQGTV